MRRVFHFLVLVLACIASNADVANAAGCARVNSNILKACGPFLTEHEHEGTVVDIPHLDNIYFPTSNADNYFQQLDSMIHREFCMSEVRMDIRLNEGDTRVNIRDFSLECQTEWLRYRCAQVFTPCQEPACSEAPCAVDRPCGSMRDKVEAACGMPYSNYELRQCDCQSGSPTEGSGGIAGCLYCPPAGCTSISLPDCSEYEQDNGGNGGDDGHGDGGNSEFCSPEDGCHTGCCCDIDPESPMQCRDPSECPGVCVGMDEDSGGDGHVLPLIILSALSAIVSIFIFIFALTGST